jgi:hypothetical protein
MELSVLFTPQPLFFREIAPDAHRIGHWVDFKADLDTVAKKKSQPLSRIEHWEGRSNRRMEKSV